MKTSINKALSEQVNIRLTKKLFGSYKETNYRTCIFISHKKEDNAQAKLIADYILQQDIDIYFDEYDYKLTTNVRNESKKVVEIINNALINSTHMICIISPKTVASWWVPFEIGYVWGKGMQRSNMRANILKGIESVPSYVDIIDKLNTYRELDNFLQTISPNSKKLITDNYKIASHHPLSGIMFK